jgi:Na+/alanine symporter
MQDNDKIVIGTEDGRILIVTDFATSQIIKIETPVKENQLIANAVTSTFPNAIESILAVSVGFLAAAKNGTILLFETSQENSNEYVLRKKLPVPDGQIRTMAISSTESNLIVELDSNQILRTPLTLQAENVVFI